MLGTDLITVPCAHCKRQVAHPYTRRTGTGGEIELCDDCDYNYRPDFAADRADMQLRSCDE